LLEGARERLLSHGVKEEDITLAWVPGALELAVVVQALADSGRYQAIIALGSVVRGDTGHYDVVVNRSTESLAKVSLETGIPVVMGVLTTENMDQAMDRAGGKKGNKGHEVALAALEMANLMRLIGEKDKS
jgi:6,7-dimethyl-8-ribityllumazine synthase